MSLSSRNAMINRKDFFHCEAVWMTGLALAPLVIGLLIALILRFTR
jgi:hypothetical protein